MPKKSASASSYVALNRRLERRGSFHIKPGLERITRILSALNNPHFQFPAIHIAGTNGKGSVSAGLECVLRQSGSRTGLYTSPHLLSVRERIQIDRQPISEALFVQSANRILAAESQTKTSLTYFEFMTALAFLVFAEARVGIAVIEVGLGGRWDATNVLPKPIMSIITSIGKDHTEWLGDTIEKIAAEKAGIIKSDGVVISGVRGPAREVIRGVAEKQKSALLEIDHDFEARSLVVDWEAGSQTIRFTANPPQSPFLKVGLGGISLDFKVHLLGTHQVDNAALVVACCEQLRQKGWTISETSLKAGLAQVHWLGRFETFALGKNKTLLIDGAHNVPGVERFLETLEQSPWRHCRKTFIVGIYREKDYRSMLKLLGPVADRLFLCRLPSDRSLTPQELKKALPALIRSRARLFQTPSAALRVALQSSEKNELVVAVGSLLLAGIVLERRPYRTPQDASLSILNGRVSEAASLCLTH